MKLNVQLYAFCVQLQIVSNCWQQVFETIYLFLIENLKFLNLELKNMTFF